MLELVDGENDLFEFIGVGLHKAESANDVIQIVAPFVFIVVFPVIKEIGAPIVAIHPAGGEVFMRDYDGKRRNATLEDFSNLQKVYQALDNVDICGYQPVSPSDVDKRVMGLHCLMASFKNSDKPILSPMELETIEEKEECLKLFDIAYGKEGYVQEHYLTWHIATPTLLCSIRNLPVRGFAYLPNTISPLRWFRHR